MTTVLGTISAFKGIGFRFRNTSAFPSCLDSVRYLLNTTENRPEKLSFCAKTAGCYWGLFCVSAGLTVCISLSFKQTLISVCLCLYHAFTREAAVSLLSGVWECEEETRWGSRLMKGPHFPHRHAHIHLKEIRKTKGSMLSELLQFV